MKVLILFAFALATASAASLLEQPFVEPLVVPFVESLEPVDQPFEDPLEKPVFWNEMKNVAEKEGRITNGALAHGGQFPHQVGLSLKKGNSGSWCGGSLIGNQWVLTAAHCTDGVSSVTVFMGSIKRASGHQVTVSSANIHQHAGYNRNTLVNDISLIRIPHVNFNNDIRAAQVANDHYTYAGRQAIASGWGQIYDGSGVVGDLRYTRQPIIENAECQRTYGGTVTWGNICIATPHGASTCQGDSGGPLILDGTNIVVGVTSFGSSRGCQSGAPAAFTRVTSFRDWIRGKTGI